MDTFAVYRSVGHAAPCVPSATARSADHAAEALLLAFAFACRKSYGTGVKAENLLQDLRDVAGLPRAGESADVEVWFEGGPNHAPKLTPLKLDFRNKPVTEIGLAFGDVLVVQEHSSRLNAREVGEQPMPAPQWIASQTAGS